MEAGVANMEKIMGTKFGATRACRSLVAVRSGARDSMPGMMDTILNLGLNDQSVAGPRQARPTTPRFAWDCYRRFIQMYGDVVLGVQKREGEDHEPFETVIEGFKHEKYHADIEDSDADRRRPAGTRQALQGARQGAHRHASSPTTRGISCAAPPAPCSAPG
jgi:pyruvate,orthophosphate dikinase